MWGLLLVPCLFIPLVSSANYIHHPVHYQSMSGENYAFGYDTGLDGAHQFHQEFRDPTGVVRGRYGYTDPSGKRRLVYYISGPEGYRAWGDIGPDAPKRRKRGAHPVQILESWRQSYSSAPHVHAHYDSHGHLLNNDHSHNGHNHNGHDHNGHDHSDHVDNHKQTTSITHHQSTVSKSYVSDVSHPHVVHTAHVGHDHDHDHDHAPRVAHYTATRVHHTPKVITEYTAPIVQVQEYRHPVCSYGHC